jgi:hypothetical protein
VTLLAANDISDAAVQLDKLLVQLLINLDLLNTPVMITETSVYVFEIAFALKAELIGQLLTGHGRLLADVDPQGAVFPRPSKNNDDRWTIGFNSDVYAFWRILFF